jgi:decaprenyl-phosphate phosphoribosyltransferase
MNFKFIRGHLEICRFDHWIKNVFVLPGLLIALSVYPEVINARLISNILIGFLAVGLIASSNYVINEILDAPFDACILLKSIVLPLLAESIFLLDIFSGSR